MIRSGAVRQVCVVFALASEAGRSLATDDTRLYYLSPDGKSIRRVLKTGGTPETFVSDPSGMLFQLAVNGGYVYFMQGNSVKRLATTFQP
jgi:hypothetical protein